MTMKALKLATGYLMISSTACATVYFVHALKPSSVNALLFFSAWLLIPHIIMSVTLFSLQRKRIDHWLWYAATIVVSSGGILFLADVILWHPDAQGALAVLMTPLLQCAAWAVAVLIILRTLRHV